MDTCVCMAESLCCPPKTITTLLIGFTPIQNVLGVKKNKNYIFKKASLVVQMVKNLSAIQETWVQFLEQDDPLEKGMSTHPSVLACRIPRREEPGGLQSMGLQRVRYE